MTSLQAVEVFNAIYGRRAIRNYTAEPVRRESIEELIAASTQAPSAMNRQPWSFAVVAGAARLRGYSDRAKAHALDRLDGPFAHSTNLLTDNADIFHGAPALVVVCATAYGRQAAEDCCLAAQNFMLAAFANGFGTCPIGLARPWLSLAATKRELGIPLSWIPIVPIVIGTAGESPQSPGRLPAHILWA